MTARNEKVVTSLALLAIVLVVFVAVGRFNGAEQVATPAWLSSRLDSALPLVPWAVWIYLSWYLSPVLLVCGDIGKFRRAAGAVLLTFVACAVLWVVIPAWMDRPNLASEGGLSILALRAVYAIDPPGNLFPSFHAALATIVLEVPRASKAAQVLVAEWMAAIWISCVLTKQHELIDVGAGIAVGVLAVWFVDRYGASYTERRESCVIDSPRALERQSPGLAL